MASEDFCHPAWEGILFIGDPHVAAFPPGHRRDDYTRTVLGKLRFCLDLAASRRFLPIILGDLFHVPRNNPNALLVELIELFRPLRPWVLVGNHDKHEARLSRDVSLAVLEAAGAIELLAAAGPAGSLRVQETRVLIGVSPDWTPIPKQVDRAGHDTVIWLSHHDLCFPGYESGRLHLRELPGVDLVVNGHIHTPKPVQHCGGTTWVNPGSIVRIARSTVTKAIRPAVSLWTPGCEALECIEVPHEAFDTIFPPLGETEEATGEQMDESLFIRGLENLALRRTTEGVGLKAFLDANLSQGEPVDRIIWELYEEVMSHGKEE